MCIVLWLYAQSYKVSLHLFYRFGNEVVEISQSIARLSCWYTLVNESDIIIAGRWILGAIVRKQQVCIGHHILLFLGTPQPLFN